MVIENYWQDHQPNDPDLYGPRTIQYIFYNIYHTYYIYAKAQARIREYTMKTLSELVRKLLHIYICEVEIKATLCVNKSQFIQAERALN